MNVFRSGPRRGSWLGLGLMGALMLAVPLGAPALAVPLDAPACEQLQAEFDTLRNEGAANDMARGPDWARANLPLGGLQRIQKYIEIEEQLNFRCGLAKTRITLPTAIEGGEEEIPGPGEATVEGSSGTVALPKRPPAEQKRPTSAATAVTVVPKTPAQPPAVQKAAPQKALAPKAAAASATAPATPKSAEKATAPPKAKPKSAVEDTPPKKKAPVQSQKKQAPADDAYRPPPRPVTSDQNRPPAASTQ